MIFEKIIKFSPSNLEHRKDYYIFLKHGSLGKMKNRYSLEGNYGSILQMMTEQIVEYYCKREFD